MGPELIRRSQVPRGGAMSPTRFRLFIVILTSTALLIGAWIAVRQSAVAKAEGGEQAVASAKSFVYKPPRHYLCYRAAPAPRIDGRLDDAVWQAVPWTEDF